MTYEMLINRIIVYQIDVNYINREANFTNWDNDNEVMWSTQKKMCATNSNGDENSGGVPHEHYKYKRGFFNYCV